jgi:hypothetical protein
MPMMIKLAAQEKYYRDIGHPEHYGLWECCFIIRRVKSTVNAMFEDWFCEVCRWQQRDQISFPVVYNRHKDKVKLKTIDFSDIRQHPDFRYTNHYTQEWKLLNESDF